jgi:FtsP/CotA-like multicopper oxidase with cupredoxin domain
MRRLIPASTLLAATLLLAACATRPQQPVAQTPVTPQPTAREQRLLMGASAQTLVGHFGNPALQVREGDSLKLQFRSTLCTLDAYLYPQSGTLKVTHIDTRTPSGAHADQASCISAIEEGRS